MSNQRTLISAALLTGVLFLTSAEAQVSDMSESILNLEPTVLDLVATVEDMDAETQDISAEVKSTLDRSGDIELRRSGDNYILSVASDILFDFDSDTLSPQAERSLTDVAKIIARDSKGSVLIVGYTDAKGADDYNLALSERRASAVVAFLTEREIPEEQLKTEGRGEAEPVAENEVGGQDNPEGRAKNRRVEFIVPQSMLQN